LPFPPDPSNRNYRDQRDDAGSVLHLYRRLIALRRRTPALSSGDFTLLQMAGGLLGYRRRGPDHACVVMVNFTDRVVVTEAHDASGAPVPLVGLRVEVSSDGSGEGEPFDGRLGADRSVVLGL
jgi:alpha-glucosidase